MYEGNAARQIAKTRSRTSTGAPFGSFMRRTPPSELALKAVALIEAARPPSLRTWDQIPMRADDLARQGDIALAAFAGRSVVFVGDHDGTSLLLGLMSALGGNIGPRRMTLLDFDERLLKTTEALAGRYGFGDRLAVRLYNVFDPLPDDLLGTHDGFLTNPPYGSRNEGESARLFLTRCIESVHSGESTHGIAILPDDNERRWTREAMRHTLAFMGATGWYTAEKVRGMHAYHLDDDPGLLSAAVVFERLPSERPYRTGLFYGGRSVAPYEIPAFYGASIKPPYPRYIRADGSPDYGLARS